MRLRSKKVFLISLCLFCLWFMSLKRQGRLTDFVDVTARSRITKATLPAAKHFVNLTMKIKNDGLIADRFQKRVDTMKKHCPNWRKSPLKRSWIVNIHFIVHLDRRLLVCAVPKAGSTSWHMLLWTMRRKEAGLSDNEKLYSNEDTINNHAMSMNLTFQQGTELISFHDGDDDMLRYPPTHKSKRILLVRHPFARLISGWHQKFLRGSTYVSLMFERYPELRNYMRRGDPHHRVAWKDFAEFIAADQTLERMDYHFQPVYRLCKPCEYAYSYIVKAEAIDLDQDWILRRLNITDVTLSRNGVPPGGSLVNNNPSEKIKEYMKQLSEDTVRTLFRIYEKDFKLFGYTFDFKSYESSGFI